MTIEALLIIGLAAWRLAYLLVEERGLFGISAGIRWLAGIRFETRTTATGSVSYEVQVAHGEIAKMLTCVYCSSFWTSALMLVLWHTEYAAIVWLCAIAAVSVFAQKVVSYV